MNKSKVLVFAAIGLAAVLISMSKNEAVKSAMSKGSKKLRKQLGKLAVATGDELADLRDSVSDKVNGLGDEARKAILEILDRSMQTSEKVKGKMREAL